VDEEVSDCTIGDLVSVEDTVKVASMTTDEYVSASMMVVELVSILEEISNVMELMIG